MANPNQAARRARLASFRWRRRSDLLILAYCSGGMPSKPACSPIGFGWFGVALDLVGLGTGGTTFLVGLGTGGRVFGFGIGAGAAWEAVAGEAVFLR